MAGFEETAAGSPFGLSEAKWAKTTKTESVNSTKSFSSGPFGAPGPVRRPWDFKFDVVTLKQKNNYSLISDCESCVDVCGCCGNWIDKNKPFYPKSALCTSGLQCYTQPLQQLKRVVDFSITRYKHTARSINMIFDNFIAEFE